MTDAELSALGEEMMAKDQSENIRLAERARKMPYPTPPISLRLSAPLLQSLERLATKQHRKRAGLIQHILWEYVVAHDGIVDATKAAAKPRRAAKASKPNDVAARAKPPTRKSAARKAS